MISLSGCKRSAWRLIVRAKNAMALAGATKKDIALFTYRCDQELAARFSEANTPAGYYQFVLNIVIQHCDIKETI